VRFKGSVVLVLIAVVIGAFYFFYFLPHQQRIEKEKELKERLFDVPVDEIDYIKIIKGKDEFELKRDGNTWIITGPKRLLADEAIISMMIDILNREKVKKVVSTDINKAAEFGLEPPYIYAFFGHGGRIDEFFVGRPSPSGAGVYLYRRGLDAIFLVSEDVASALSHDLYSLRKKEPFVFDKDHLKRIVIRRKKDTLDLSKTSLGWFMRSPIEGRCSLRNVLKLIEDIATVRADEFFDESVPEPSDYPKSAKIELVEDSGRQITIDVYFWGTSVNRGIVVYQHGLSYYARVGRDFWNNIHQDASSFRYRNLFEFKPEEAFKIAVRKDKESLLIERKGRKWMYKDRPLDDTMVEEFMELLNGMEAYRLVEKEEFKKGKGSFSLTVWGRQGNILGVLKVYGEAPRDSFAFSEEAELKTYYAESTNLVDKVIVTNLQMNDIYEAIKKTITEVGR